MEPFMTDLCKFTRRNVTSFDVILWLFDVVAGHVFCQKIFNGASPTKIGTNQTLKKNQNICCQGFIHFAK